MSITLSCLSLIFFFINKGEYRRKFPSMLSFIHSIFHSSAEPALSSRESPFLSEHTLMHIFLLDLPFFQNLQNSVPVLQGCAPGHAAACGYASGNGNQPAGSIVFPAGFLHSHCICSCVKCYNQFFLFFSHCYSITTAKPSGISVEVYIFPRSFASFSTFIF